jgi:uncharacterized repeat protein (TIGR01451 family)
MNRKLGELRRHSHRRWWAVGATFVAVAVFSVVFVAASGANLTGSTFESTDGNLVVNTSGNTDWKNVAGLQPNIDQPTGSADNSFTQGTKEDDPNVTIAAGSIPPNKNDLTRSYLASEVVGGQTFLYLAWERTVNTGSANIDFELNQNPTTGWDGSTLGDVTINRTEGDLLFTYDFSGSGSPTLGLLTWLTTSATPAHSNDDCYASGAKLPCWGNHITLTPSGTPAADGAVNTADVVDDVTSPAVGTLTAGLFGEAAINLSAIPGVFAPDTCKAFGSQFVKSRASGSSIDAELKDFIAPSPIHVSNCGSIELKKEWAGTAGTATLNIGTQANGHDTAQTTVTGQGGTTGPQTVENGSYYVSEVVTNPSDYTSNLDCTDNGQAVAHGTNPLPVSAGHEVVCTFTNTRKTGTVEVKKTLVPANDSGRFDFSIGASSFDNNGNGYGDGGTTGAQTKVTGNYAVSESAHAGTNAANYTSTWSCTQGEVTRTGTGTSVTGGVNVGSLPVVCTFTNTRLQGTIELKKHWVGGADNVTLNIGSTAGTHDVATTPLTGTDGTTGAKTVNAGTYFVSEVLANPGAYDKALACVNGEQTVTPSETGGVAVGSGDHIVCTFTNSRLPQVKLVKELVPSSDSGTFDFAIDNQSFTNGGDGYGDGGTTGFVSIQPGAPVISESGNGNTDLNQYDSSISCSNEDSGLGTTLDLSSVTYGDQVTCTFTNVRLATIEIVKHTLGSAGSFDFTINQGENSDGFTLTTDSSGGTDTLDIDRVPAGDYTVVEAGRAGWALTGLSCTTAQGENSSGGSQDKTNPNQANIHVTDGGFVQCTYTNTKLATLVVKKVVDNSNGGGSKSPGDFSLHVTAAGLELPGSPAAGSSTGSTYSGLMPGTYKVSEDSVSGYSLTGISGCLADGSVVLDAGATVTCTLTNTSAAPPPPSPPPAPPAPKVDLQITKTGTPNPVTVGNQVTWTMVVTNNGPNGATNVTVADPVPAGTSFVSVASSAGTCTGGAVVNCQLGSMAVGSSVTITLVTTAGTTGTLTNTATTVAAEQETNTANNTATASVVAKGVFVPPVRYCTAVSVAPKKTLFVGRKTTLTLKVTQNGKAVKGIRIKIKGAKLGITTAPSNAKGIVKVTFKPTKAGIVTFAPVSSTSCANPRIGVTGVFTPPVTG